MSESDFDYEPLSPVGASRRDAMLRELQEAIPRVHRRRRRRRTLIGSALVVIGAAAVGLLVFPRRSVPLQPVAVRPESVAPVTPRVPDPSPPRRSLVFDYVDSSPDIVERFAAHGTGLIVIVDDATLVTELAAIDRHAGVVRRGGQVWLTADVIDGL